MPPLKDETGKRYGRLSVIKRVENIGECTAYLCRCDCGTEKIVRGESLRKGDIVSCGCYQKEQVVKNHAKSVERKRKEKNIYMFDGESGICLIKNKAFLFDKEDYDKIKVHTWQIGTHGYAMNATVGLLHRYILGNPDGYVDHINHFKTDNRKENLRICTCEENACNRGPQKNNTSGYKGVSYDKSRGKYAASIKRGDQSFTLGRFSTAEEAAHAYDRKAIELHGKFANLNFPLEYYEEKKEVK